MTPDEKFRKAEHILKSRDFRAVYRNGRAFKKNGFVLSVHKTSLGCSRLGFSISSASVKHAVSRNRIRRLFREVYRTNKAAFKSAYDMVLIVRKDPGNELKYAEVERLLFAMAKDAGILI